MAHYMVVIEKGGNNFSAYSPDVPGCITTGKTLEETGKTLEETLGNMEDALCFHLEGLYEDGDPLPEPRNPEDHIRDMDVAAGDDLMTVESTVILA